MSEEFGPLPEPMGLEDVGVQSFWTKASNFGYSADQMRAYAAKAVAAERERWLVAFASARDMVLHDRGPLAEQGMDNDKTNAVLAVLDDCFVELT